jgi:hypothetical protein
MMVGWCNYPTQIITPQMECNIFTIYHNIAGCISQLRRDNYLETYISVVTVINLSHF